MKNTPFTQKHIGLGAKMAEFAGYNMPISYSGINDEHASVRNNAGVFDVSHMGEFILKGENALDLIQRTTSNDASKLTEGKAQYSCLPNKDGGIVDDLIVYCLEENKAYMLVVTPAILKKTGTGYSSSMIRRWRCIIYPTKPACLPYRAPMQQRYYSRLPGWIL